MPEPLFVRMLTGDDLVVEAPIPIDWRGRSARALFALLALQPGEPVSRDRLVALLWPNSDQQAGRASLRMALLALRRALDPVDPDLIRASNESITLALDRAAIDWVQFEALAAAPDRALRLEALDLYRGDLATVFDGPHEGAVEMLRDLRERLRDLAIATGAGLIAEFNREGARKRIRPVAEKILTIDPANEPTHRTMMQLAAMAGDRPAVLRQFEQCRRALAEQYGLEPSAETVALRDRLIGAPGGERITSAGAGRPAAGQPVVSAWTGSAPPRSPARRKGLVAAFVVLAAVIAVIAVLALIRTGSEPELPSPVVAVSLHFEQAEADSVAISDAIRRAFEHALHRIPGLVVVFEPTPAEPLPGQSFAVTATVQRSVARLRFFVEIRDVRSDGQDWMGRPFQVDADDPDRIGRALEDELDRELIPEIRSRISAGTGGGAPPR